MTVICPNCGSGIAAPKKKVKTIKCPNCDMAGLDFGLDYFDEEDNPKRSFSEKHPKLTKAGYVAFAGACTAFVWWMKNKDLFTEESIPEHTPIAGSSSEPLLEDSIPAEQIRTNDSAYVNPEDYDSILREHGLSIRNLSKNRTHSPEKGKQATALGINLPPHQTIVNPFSQHHRVKKQEV